MTNDLLLFPPTAAAIGSPGVGAVCPTGRSDGSQGTEAICMRRGNRQTCRRGGVVRLRLLAALALGFGLARLAGLPHVAADPPAKPGAAAEPGGTAEGPEQSAYS